MKKIDGIARAAGLVGLMTFLSRIAGYLRDVIVAYYFGATGTTDAFYVAFRIPNLLRRLFAEGSLTVAFIPVFTEYMEKEGREEAKRIADAVFTLLLIILVLVTAAGVIFSPLVIKLFASGFSPENFALAVGLNRIVFPYILLVSLVALSMGVLNSLRHFFAPAISPLLLNLGIIGTFLILTHFMDASIYWVGVGVIVGGVIQVVFQVPFLKARGFLFGLTKSLSHPAVKRIGLLMTPQLFGVAVYNLNILISTQYASHLPEGTVSYLYFAERLIEFPLGIIAVSIATALLPSLSSYAAKGQRDRYVHDYTFALRLMLYIMIPALVGLIVLRVPICSVLYQRGEFGYKETVLVSQALFGYALGLWAVGGVRITAPTFYALKDTKTPVIVAFLSLVLNASAGYLLAFTFDLKHIGIALASSCSAIVHFLILFALINRRMGRINFSETALSVFKAVVASLVMGTVAWWISELAPWSSPGLTWLKVAVLLGSVAAAGALYLYLTKLMGMEEAGYVWDMLMRKHKRSSPYGGD
ncbi:MAG: murein biosynthesis integral membrane protein MurJ [Thermodesulfobacteriota bacterium]